MRNDCIKRFIRINGTANTGSAVAAVTDIP